MSGFGKATDFVTPFGAHCPKSVSMTNPSLCQQLWVNMEHLVDHCEQSECEVTVLVSENIP